MTLEEKNQLFIDSIWHWIVDGVEQFEQGKYISDSYLDRWDDGTECKLNGEYCSLCEYFEDDCILCFIYNTYNCCHAYSNFHSNPTINNCYKVVDYLWNKAMSVSFEEYNES